jgi:hypothetical protein
MSYVIYFKDLHDKERYAARGMESGFRVTDNLDEALRFATAREAYDFAGDRELYNARVGVR